MVWNRLGPAEFVPAVCSVCRNALFLERSRQAAVPPRRPEHYRALLDEAVSLLDTDQIGILRAAARYGIVPRDRNRHSQLLRDAANLVDDDFSVASGDEAAGC